MALTWAHEAELRDRGWTVIRGFTGAATTAAARRLVDDILGGAGPRESVDVAQVGGRAGEPLGQPGPWPAAAASELPLPVIQSSGWRHGVMHPIPDPLMATFVRVTPPILPRGPGRQPAQTARLFV